MAQFPSFSIKIFELLRTITHQPSFQMTRNLTRNHSVPIVMIYIDLGLFTPNWYNKDFDDVI